MESNTLLDQFYYWKGVASNFLAGVNVTKQNAKIHIDITLQCQNEKEAEVIYSPIWEHRNKISWYIKNEIIAPYTDQRAIECREQLLEDLGINKNNNI